MEQNEFKNLKKIKDSDIFTVEHYILASGEEFYIEPNFYTQLQGVKRIYEDKYDQVINCLLDIVKTNKKVIFTADFENPVVYKKDFIYREILDITDKLKIVIDDKT